MATTAPMADRDAVPFLGLRFDRLSTAQVLGWLRMRSAADAFAYVVTPNVDHMIRLQSLPPDLARAYHQADLCLCDSRILARLARSGGLRLPLAPGSDVTRALFTDVLAEGDTVCLIGGTPAHAGALRALFPHLNVVQHVPPMGVLHDTIARAAAIDAAVAARARVTLLAVGSPQQERIALEMRADGRMLGTALCIGASVDFVVGAERRAPAVVQRAGLEWAWRLASNPRRLARRYLVEGPAIFPLYWRWRREQGPARSDRT